MKLTRIGVDVAKQVFQVHGVDRLEQPVWRRRLSRDRWLKAVMEVAEPGCEIGMEACGGAHHWDNPDGKRPFPWGELLSKAAIFFGLCWAIVAFPALKAFGGAG
ncbi:hypothetical protein [Dyella silvae]|uniref:hypothetical protein n=1 Tax=Dyella silvae TaxID=2994424 RepID=UPI00226490F9|nr:hypothetical protein [Dyella silvae]